MMRISDIKTCLKFSFGLAKENVPKNKFTIKTIQNCRIIVYNVRKAGKKG